jgi:hypothetical protein
VLKITETPHLPAGFLSSYGWDDLTNSDEWDARLSQLTAALGLQPEKAPQPRTAASGPAITVFRNRHDELQKVLHGVTNAAGPHFWLLNAPPELGKTWFLGRLSAEVSMAGPDQWVARLVDLRERSVEAPGDAGEILASMLRLPYTPDAGTETLRGIARDVSNSGKSYLCLLDSAELLPDDTVRALRSRLGRIYKFIQEAGNINVRVALVVASRRDDKWRGVLPSPRLDMLSLTQFSVHVVVDALVSMARQMNRSFDNAFFWRNGELVHRLSEGLPAVLVRCLQWIRQEQWLDLDRLASQEIFEELAGPYINKLLSADSLLPGAESPSSEAPKALSMALRALAPYRLFTQSHLRQYLDTNPDFQRVVDYLDWSLEDLWSIISSTALLKRPLDEPWQKIHDAIRRLLYKYYYRTTEQRVNAHREARKFVEVWADQQRGREQAVGMVECLWHEAEVLRLANSDETGAVLSESAHKFAQAIQPSAAFTKQEIRQYTANRIREDEELQESVKHIDGLIDSLAEIVLAAQDT